MKTNLEIEYKTLLSLAEYDQLSKRFSHVKPIQQTNYYFDTPDFKLRENKLALRIRRLTNRGEMTLKIPQKIGNLEYNSPLTLEEAKALLALTTLPETHLKIQEILDLLCKFSINVTDIGLLGTLTTTRLEYQTKIGLMALDKNNYSGKIDYELELEVGQPETGEADFKHFLKQNHVQYRYAKSKVVRFLKTLEATSNI
jgi:uncharacterized protein YjbK